MNTRIRTVSIEGENEHIYFVYKNWTIYLTKKEIAKLFSVDKDRIKSILKDINWNNKHEYLQSKGSKKLVKVYTLDTILLIWYKLHSFEATKELIKINRILGNTYKKRDYILNTVAEKYNTIKNQLSSLIGIV